YVEQENVYAQIVNSIQRTAPNFQNSGNVSLPATGRLVTPAQAAGQPDCAGSTLIPAVPGTFQWVTTSSFNGTTIQTGREGGATPARGHPPCRPGTPAVAAVYDPPGSGPINGPVGYQMAGVVDQVNPILHCPTDPTWGSGIVETSYAAT